jgi:hypothetical protein
VNFSKDKSTKDGLQRKCKQCNKEYRENNKDKIRNYQELYRKDNKTKTRESNILYYIKNKDSINNQQKLYRNENKDKIKEYKKEYYNSNVKYESHKDKLTIDESPRLHKDGELLEVKCRYCGKYFIPTYMQVENRLKSLNNTNSENSLYCSDGCKQSCPIFNQRV